MKSKYLELLLQSCIDKDRFGKTKANFSIAVLDTLSVREARMLMDRIRKHHNLIITSISTKEQQTQITINRKLLKRNRKNY